MDYLFICMLDKRRYKVFKAALANKHLMVEDNPKLKDLDVVLRLLEKYNLKSSAPRHPIYDQEKQDWILYSVGGEIRTTRAVSKRNKTARASPFFLTV